PDGDGAAGLDLVRTGRRDADARRGLVVTAADAGGGDGGAGKDLERTGAQVEGSEPGIRHRPARIGREEGAEVRVAQASRGTRREVGQDVLVDDHGGALAGRAGRARRGSRSGGGGPGRGWSGRGGRGHRRGGWRGG